MGVESLKSVSFMLQTNRQGIDEKWHGELGTALGNVKKKNVEPYCLKGAVILLTLQVKY